jgi:hypothetical protein
LRHRLANHPTAIGDPVLPTLTNINGGTHGGFDAVLRRTATGEPDTANPMVPDWPKADFIVGNPPFIGGQDLREELGDEYAEALWKANPRVQGSADFVMQWWDHAAWLLTRPDTTLRRFGFVTTNSITQTFSRRVIESYLHKSSPERGGGAGEARDGGGSPSETSLEAESPLHPQPVAGGPPPHSGEDAQRLSLILAIPDHPWTKATKDAAAVRIAMTVAEAGAHDGRLVEIVNESGLDTDEPTLVVRETVSRIHSNLSVGADATSAIKLQANSGICHDGVKLHGKGFSITKADAIALGLGKREGLEKYIRPYRNGKDLTSRTPAFVQDKFVVDLFGLDEKQVRQDFPEVYQHLLTTVRIAREAQVKKSATADAKAYLEQWWLMGKPRPEMRPALNGLKRYLGTVDTAKHRIFQFLPAEMLCDDGMVIVCSDNAFELGVLSSLVHLKWTLANCGLMGVATIEQGHRYFKTQIFDPFPFPDATPEQRAAIAEIAEELDATRKAALAEVPGLTMTEIYNLRGLLQSGEKLSPIDEDRARAARAGIVHHLHEQIDAAVAGAYGWPANLTPSEIVTRLVALNAERAKEEAEGKIRWLRPDYQIPRFGSKK